MIFFLLFSFLLTLQEDGGGGGEGTKRSGMGWNDHLCVCTPLFLLLVVVLPFSLCVFLVMERTDRQTDLWAYIWL
jgi:hypothetical protein